MTIRSARSFTTSGASTRQASPTGFGTSQAVGGVGICLLTAAIEADRRRTSGQDTAASGQEAASTDMRRSLVPERAGHSGPRSPVLAGPGSGRPVHAARRSWLSWTGRVSPLAWGPLARHDEAEIALNGQQVDRLTSALVDARRSYAA